MSLAPEDPAKPLALSAAADDAGWISLAEAAHLLHTAPTNVRRWADQGRLEVRRTVGGHRRFRRESVLALGGQLPTPVLPAVAPGWQVHFQQPAEAARMRGLGQRLLGLLVQWVLQDADDSRHLDEGYAIGQAYGAEAAGAAASRLDIVEAFLFYRSSSIALALQGPTAALTDSAAVVRLWERADHFMNRVLLGLIAGYDARLDPAGHPEL